MLTLARRSAVLGTLIVTFCGFALAQTPVVRKGLFRGRVVTYKVTKGHRIFEGDIALDHVQEITTGVGGFGLGYGYNQYLWPKVGSVYQVPYTITSGDQKVVDSINTFNATFPGLLQWVPRTTEADWVDFNLDPNDHSGVCNSYIGRVGGEQEIWGSIDCANQLHEMGHAVGLWHEQSRADRDTYISVNYNNIIKIEQINFDKVQEAAEPLGLYDYASIMQYYPTAFTKNGGTTIETIPPGIPLTAFTAYSAGDGDSIKRLYGAPPATVTVTSNPPGLQVTVDGTTITTPQTFNWPLDSTHTLAASNSVQTVGGTPYVYGRWSDDVAASHSITVLPGNGLISQPANLPAVTVYSANFIKLVPYTAAVFPANSGTIVATPSAQSYPGGTGVYYVARQPVSLQATPNAGQNFYGFFNSPFWLPYALSANPKNFNAPDDGNPINMTGYFTSSPVYQVTTNLADPGLGVLVDGGFWYAPKNFSSAYDAGWTSGSSHSIGVYDPQLPWSTTFRYPWVSWNDGGSSTHNVTLPSASTTYTANLNGQFQLLDWPNQSCAGSIDVTPGSPTGDGFYDSGSLLSFNQTAASGWTFTGWQHDLSGTGNPQNLTVADEIYVTSDYNTASPVLTMTSLVPAAAVAGAGNLTLAINGTGFTSGSLVFINGVFRTSTFVNANTLTVAMTSADFAVPGGFQVFVENFPNGAACAAYAARTFYVANHPIVTPTPLSVSFPAQVIGTTSAVKVVTVKNNGTTAVSISSITASGNFAEVTNCPPTLNAGASCKINVTFTPTTAGTITGAVAINDSSPDSPQVIALSGIGTTAVTMAPASLSFGSVPVGNTSSPKTVTLTNNQSTTLTFSFAASGNYTAVGSGATPCTTSLAAKAKCTMSVSFKPTAAGAISGALTVTHNAPFSPQEVGLSGTGTGGSTPPLTFTPPNASFTNQVVGTISPVKVVTVKNVSASSLTISSLTASGNYAAQGAGSTPCGGTLAAGASCTMSVTFTPTLAGKIVGAAVITDTAPVNQQVFNLQGTAILPVSFSPTALTFVDQTVGTTSSPQTVTMTNNQTSFLTINGISGSGDYMAVPGGTSPCGSSLAPHGHCTFTVTFTPSAVGIVKGAATVTHNAAFNPQMVTLTGTGK